MRKSKYVGMKSGTWECVHMGVADVQPAFCRRKIAGKEQCLQRRLHLSVINNTVCNGARRPKKRARRNH